LEKYINKKFAASDFFDEFIQPRELLVVEFQIHSIVDLIIFKRDVILVDSVPFFQYDFFPTSSSLGGNQLLQVSDGVIRIAFNTNFLTQAVVTRDFNHFRIRI